MSDDAEMPCFNNFGSHHCSSKILTLLGSIPCTHWIAFGCIHQIVLNASWPYDHPKCLKLKRPIFVLQTDRAL